MTAIATAVTVERRDNVIYLDFSPSVPPPALGEEDPRWPATVGEELAPATGPARRVPARWSPRPGRVLAGRFRRSQFAADLREWAFVVGLLTAVVVVLAAGDHFRPLVHHMFGDA